MSLWLAIPMYWVLLGAACRRNKTYSLHFRFLEGVILAYLCFIFLPSAFLAAFLSAGIGSVLGIVAGVWIEERYGQFTFEKELCSVILFTMVFLFEAFTQSASFVLASSVLGGMALYFACVGLFPEGRPIKETVPIAVGGVFGFILGVAVCFI
ncbi:MAG: hypothetical protein ACK5I7_00360 [Anaerotignum sp.]